MKTSEDGAKEKLMNVLDSILANYALVLGDWTAYRKLNVTDRRFIMSSVSFEGGISGTLYVAASGLLCRALAAGILGMEPDDKDIEAGISDAMKEFANITCGHFVTAFVGKEAVVDLHTPALREITETQWKEMAEKAGGGYVIDGEPITARVSITGGGAK